jgi:hypothetical protein
MRVVVNHLTRMQPGYVCVAGIDLATRRHVRPVLRGRLTTDLLTVNGGPFDLASEVDLGPVQHCGCAPFTEDHMFQRFQARRVAAMASEDFWQQLSGVSQTSIEGIFGAAIKPLRHGCVIDVGMGEASLGCFVPVLPPLIYINDQDRIRIVVMDGQFNVDLSVTDIRFWEADHRTPRRDLVERIDKRLQSGNPVILSIGLTRPWKHPDDTMERHWLQVNNIHVYKDGGLWD